MSAAKKSLKLVLDVGTTGVKGMVFDSHHRVLAKAYAKLGKRVAGARVEQDPMELIRKSTAVLRRAVKGAGRPLSEYRGFGLTNQRETVVAWDRKTGRSICPAIVWEDSRTAAYCRALSGKCGREVLERAGLPVEPYFSASKMRWVLDNAPAARKLAEQGRLAFGTVDSWMAWNLGAGRPHVTDMTNASRTLLFNPRLGRWDVELLDIFMIDGAWLPKPLPPKSNFGNLDRSVVGASLPILAMCGDQQSSTFAAGVTPYATKVTFGTGTFVAQVLPKMAHRKGFYTAVIPKGRGIGYALEAKIEGSGAAASKALHDPKRLDRVVRELARKTAALVRKLPHRPAVITVDGGISQSDTLVSELARLTKARVRRLSTYDGTALGVSKLVG